MRTSFHFSISLVLFPLMGTSSLFAGEVSPYLQAYEGSGESPWYFHTGEGYRTQSLSLRDPDTGALKLIETKTPCDLKSNSCREKVYFFNYSEIESFIDTTRTLLRAKREGHFKSSLFWTGAAAISTKTTIGLAAAPTGVSQALAVVTGVGAGVSALFAANDVRNIVKINSNLDAIIQFLTDERDYATRCNHVRSSFRKEAEELGIHLFFEEEGGSLISPDFFQSAAESEKKLYQETLDYAAKHGITSCQAYKEFFYHQCQQVPVRDLSPSRVEALCSPDWESIPENVKRSALKASSKLELLSGNPIEIRGFDSNDLLKPQYQQDLQSFFVELESDIAQIEESGSQKQKKALSWFKNRISQVVVSRKWKGSSNKSYDLVTLNGESILYVNALWKWRSFWTPGSANTYQASLREFMFDHGMFDHGMFE